MNFKFFLGYGRNEGEAFSNSWKNFVDYILGDEKLLRYMKKSIRDSKIIIMRPEPFKNEV